MRRERKHYTAEEKVPDSNALAHRGASEVVRDWHVTPTKSSNCT